MIRLNVFIQVSAENRAAAVSYTHLDVYKRQPLAVANEGRTIHTSVRSFSGGVTLGSS